MKVEWNPMFRGLMEEEDDIFGGGGGNPNADVDENDDLDNDLDENEDDLDEDDEDEKSGQLSPEQIANLAAQAAVKAGGGNFQQQQSQMSQEDMLKALHYHKVSPDLVAALRNPELPPEKVVEMLQGMVDGGVKHSLAAMQVIMQQNLGPLQQFQQEQQARVVEQQTKEFVGKVEKNFPALKGMGPVIKQAIQNLRQSGFNPPSKSAAYKEVARTAARMVKTINPSFSLKQGGNGNRQAGSFGARASGGKGSQGNVVGKVGAASFADLLPGL